jgi:chromosome partitioning protein
MGPIIAVANQKGGVGKTTTAVNLSACLAVAGKKTLLVDIDPQGNATSGVGIDKNANDKCIYEILINGLSPKEVLRKTEMALLEVLPSHLRLVGAEVELVDLEGRELLLRKALSDIRSDYDYIIIDCPPALSLLTINALAAADSVIIPVQCEYYALEGLSQLLDTINLIKRNINPQLAIGGFLLTMYDVRLNLSKQVVEEARKFFGGRVFKTIIQRNVRLSEAPSFGKPILLYDVISTGAENYIRLSREIMNGE